jgi:hypothetical protein
MNQTISGLLGAALIGRRNAGLGGAGFGRAVLDDRGGAARDGDLGPVWGVD